MADLGAIAVTREPLKTFVPVAGAISPSSPQAKTISTSIKQPTGVSSFQNSSNPVENVLDEDRLYQRIIPTWALDYRGYFPNNTGTTLIPRTGINTSGTISGQVREEGTPVAGRKVLLYYRPTNVLIMRTISDASGNFTFTGLEAGANHYYVTSINVEPLNYDAVTHDTVGAV